MIRRVANVDPTLRPFQWTQSEIARHAEMENGDLRTLSCSARIESPRICRSTVDPKFSALLFSTTPLVKNRKDWRCQVSLFFQSRVFEFWWISGSKRSRSSERKAKYWINLSFM